MEKKYKILIIGGGSGGIMVAAQLINKGESSIGIIEPSDTHYYQAAWTLVGAGTYDLKKTARPMASVIPQKADWIKDRVTRIDAEKNTVTTETKGTITYEYLIVSPGLVYDMSLVEGLSGNMNKGVICSNYTDPEHTWKVLQNFKGGTALFTQPTTPIKCGGAPQKIMYLADSYFRKSGVRNKTNVVFATNGGVIFGVKEIAQTLTEVLDRKDINVRYGHQLKKIDAENQIAWYALGSNQKEYNHKDIQVEKDGDLVGIHYDMLHMAPPSVAPKFVCEAGLCNDANWMDVNINTLQSSKYPNIFGLGDVAALPTAKTGAAIRKQVPVIVENIISLQKENKLGDKLYNGYSSCPLVTDYGKMVLAEFDYGNNFLPDPKLKQMLIKDSSKEHWRLWVLKKYILPYLYWNKMLKGIDV